MKRLILTGVACLALTGCGWDNLSRENNWSGEQKPGLSEIQHRNQSIKMDVLDEITIPNQPPVIIIRFIDAGHTRYVAIRSTEVSVMSHAGNEDDGYEDESISTVR